MRAAYYVLIFGRSGSSPPTKCLARARQQATGVPTATVDDPHSQSRALPELAVVAIANFVSEFGQLRPERPPRLRRGGIAAVTRLEPGAAS
jgi:hypothetical protein